MKRTLCIALTALCLAATALTAQTTPGPEPGATYLESFTAAYSTGECTTTSRKKDFEWLVVVWRTQGGSTVYSIDASTVVGSSACGGVAEMTTVEIFDLLALRTVHLGIGRGELIAPGNCSTPATTSVAYAFCVVRSVSGNVTSFGVSGTGQARQSVGFCGSGGAVVENSVGRTGSGSCGTLAESTWDAEGAGLQ